MDWTFEQRNIIKSNDSFMHIIAFAGTGKTTTLVQYAINNPQKKILYIAYNDSVVKEAKKKFPPNVNVMTSHSLAYAKVGNSYKNKLKSFIKVDEVRKALLLKRNSKNIIISKKVLEGIEKFCYSSYLNLFDAYYMVEDIPCSKENYNSFLKRIWDKMENKTSKFPVIHDFYLKKFEMLSPKLDYDCILFDEAQDANPATKSIIMKQRMYKNMTILFVGDNHQEIYSFRGSKNALSREKNQKYKLTESFRFGNNIANVANSLLNLLKKENLKIKGNKKIKDSINNYNTNLQTAIISRTNAMVIANAIQKSEENKKIYFVGGIKDYNFSKIIDVDNLYKGNTSSIIDKNIKRYKTFDNFEKQINLEENKEYLFLSKIVKKYSEKLRNSMDNLNKLIVYNKEEADIILSTAHKSKGLEFEQVILSNDFNKFFDKEDNLKQNIKEEEINILYVALTRAMYSLITNKELDKMLRIINEKK